MMTMMTMMTAGVSTRATTPTHAAAPPTTGPVRVLRGPIASPPGLSCCIVRTQRPWADLIDVFDSHTPQARTVRRTWTSVRCSTAAAAPLFATTHLGTGDAAAITASPRPARSAQHNADSFFIAIKNTMLIFLLSHIYIGSCMHLTRVHTARCHVHQRCR
jgi:hypothetical protein